MDVFDDYSAYYDLLYQQKDYRAEAAYIHKLIKTHHSNVKSILDLGCGTGAHDFFLAEMGYNIVGVDQSEKMLNIAEEKKNCFTQEIQDKVSFIQGDIRDLKLDEKPDRPACRTGRFDVVTALFHVMSYQTTDDDLQKAFATAAKYLNPGGVFIFDCWYGPAVLAELPEKREKTLEDDTLLIKRTALPVMKEKEQLVEVNYTINITTKATGKTIELKETHRMRYLFLPEIESLFISHGFEMLLSEEWLSSKALGESTWSACFVAKK